MRPPTSDEQIRFLVNVQRLLDEGSFVASYKFALLLALADLSIEKGDDSGAPLALNGDQIAEKFIAYYWRQALPYQSPRGAGVLKQNTDKQAAIINAVVKAQAEHGASFTGAMRGRAEWRRFVRKVAGIVAVMPLWKLQTVGRERLEFLYANTDRGREVELKPGVAACFRKFHALISDLVRGAWLRYVRQQNLSVLGETADLNEFLFGSERSNLKVVRNTLLEIDGDRCFYCNRMMKGVPHVDHFVAWARYPTDLAHNFVLADDTCNRHKRDRLPAFEHLERWVERNAEYGTQIAAELERRGVVAELAASNRVAEWAYAQTEAAQGLTWVRSDEMVALAAGWRGLLTK